VDRVAALEAALDKIGDEHRARRLAEIDPAPVGREINPFMLILPEH
jgi:hypothetical protein